MLDPARFVPAAGQGMLALEGRTEDAARGRRCGDHRRDAFACLLAERALARALGRELPHAARRPRAAPAGCGCLQLRAWVGLPDGSAWVSDRAARRVYDPEALGRRVAERLRAAGAEEMLRRAEELAVSALSGRVYLVGAGPGDPGLLTARALELIAAADVILYDRLIPAAALDGARADAELLFVGKEGGGAVGARRSRPRR